MVSAREVFAQVEELDGRIGQLEAHKAELKALLAEMIPENEVVEGIRHKAWDSVVVNWNHFAVSRKDYGAVISQESWLQKRHAFLKSAD